MDWRNSYISVNLRHPGFRVTDYTAIFIAKLSYNYYRWAVKRPNCLKMCIKTIADIPGYRFPITDIAENIVLKNVVIDLADDGDVTVIFVAAAFVSHTPCIYDVWERELWASRPSRARTPLCSVEVFTSVGWQQKRVGARGKGERSNLLGGGVVGSYRAPGSARDAVGD